MRFYLAIASGITGLIAAFLWFWSARTSSVRPISMMKMDEYLVKSANFNAWAASFTGVSVLLGTASNLMP